MSNNMAKIADARKTVEQLKLEVNIERMMVSEERRSNTPSCLLVQCEEVYYSQTMNSLFPHRCPRPQRI